MNVVLCRVLYTHALVAAPRMSLGWLRPLAPFLGDPRLGMTGIFLQLSRVLPDEYPLTDAVDAYLSNELGFGRLLDFGVILPRLQQIYEWSADVLDEPGLRRLRPRRGDDLRLAVRGAWRLASTQDVRRAPGAAVPPAGTGAGDRVSHAMDVLASFVGGWGHAEPLAAGRSTRPDVRPRGHVRRPDRRHPATRPRSGFPTIDVGPATLATSPPTAGARRPRARAVGGEGPLRRASSAPTAPSTSAA